jgi:hypothetical protein
VVQSSSWGDIAAAEMDQILRPSSVARSDKVRCSMLNDPPPTFMRCQPNPPPHELPGRKEMSHWRLPAVFRSDDVVRHRR